MLLSLNVDELLPGEACLDHENHRLRMERTIKIIGGKAFTNKLESCVAKIQGIQPFLLFLAKVLEV